MTGETGFIVVYPLLCNNTVRMTFENSVNPKKGGAMGDKGEDPFLMVHNLTIHH
jgi:hypothetical protein